MVCCVARRYVDFTLLHAAIVNSWPPPVSDFGIEYAISGRAVCRACEEKIGKHEMRVSKLAYTTDIGMRVGGVPWWYHVECFASHRSELGWLKAGEFLPGFEKLSEKDQLFVEDSIP